MALLGLRATGMNHRQGEVIFRCGDRYGVLLVGASEPVAVRPVNLRPIEGVPVYRERPQERGAADTAPLRWHFSEPAQSCANVVTGLGRWAALSSSSAAAQQQPGSGESRTGEPGRSRSKQRRKPAKTEPAPVAVEASSSDPAASADGPTASADGQSAGGQPIADA